MKKIVINIFLSVVITSLVAQISDSLFGVAILISFSLMIGFGLALLGLLIKVCTLKIRDLLTEFYLYRLLVNNYKTIAFHTFVFVFFAFFTDIVNSIYIEKGFEVIGEPYYSFCCFVQKRFLS